MPDSVTRSRRPPPLVLAAAVVLVGIGTSAFLARASADLHTRSERERFLRQVDRGTLAIRTRLDVAASVLRSSQGMFQASMRVEPEEFEAYAQVLRVRLEKHGVAYLAYLERAAPGALAELEARHAARPGFRVRGRPGAGDAADHRVLVYAEPPEEGADALGYDAGTVPELREVLDACCEANDFRMSPARRHSASETSAGSVFLFLPVFPPGPAPEDPAERRAKVVGWVAAVLRVPDILRGAARDSYVGIDLEVFDGPPSPETLLFDLDGHLDEGRHPETALERYRGRSQWTQFPLHLYGREWSVRASSLRAFDAEGASDAPLVTLVVGSVLGLLAAASVWSLASTRERAERLADERNASLRRALADLEAQHEVVRKQAAELVRARDETLAAMKAKSEFLATVTHEIRTPMTGVVGMTSLLLDTKLLPEQREYANHVRTSADQLLAIVNDLLDFSKTEAGRLRLEIRDLDVRASCAETARVLSPLADAKGLKVLVTVAEDVPRTLGGDPLRLRQVLVNLGGNAVKFSSKGDVLLSCRVLERAGDSVLLRFEVTDEGIGIPADVLTRLFEPFVQADASTTRKYGGTGLGLALAKRIVDLMGGRIGAESRQGEGSTFWFEVRLPVRA